MLKIQSSTVRAPWLPEPAVPTCRASQTGSRRPALPCPAASGPRRHRGARPAGEPTTKVTLSLRHALSGGTDGAGLDNGWSASWRSRGQRRVTLAMGPAQPQGRSGPCRSGTCGCGRNSQTHACPRSDQTGQLGAAGIPSCNRKRSSRDKGRALPRAGSGDWTAQLGGWAQQNEKEKFSSYPPGQRRRPRGQPCTPPRGLTPPSLSPSPPAVQGVRAVGGAAPRVGPQCPAPQLQRRLGF